MAADPHGSILALTLTASKGGVSRCGALFALRVVLEDREPPAKGNLFLVNVDINDPLIAAETIKRVYARRRERSGGINEALPLSEWLDGQSPTSPK